MSGDPGVTRRLNVLERGMWNLESEVRRLRYEGKSSDEAPKLPDPSADALDRAQRLARSHRHHHFGPSVTRDIAREIDSAVKTEAALWRSNLGSANEKLYNLVRALEGYSSNWYWAPAVEKAMREARRV